MFSHCYAEYFLLPLFSIYLSPKGSYLFQMIMQNEKWYYLWKGLIILPIENKIMNTVRCQRVISSPSSALNLSLEGIDIELQITLRITAIEGARSRMDARAL